MLLLIDNYDSFTWNLYHLIGVETHHNIKVVRNDAISAKDAIDMRPSAIIISPGPCTPNEAGICLELIKSASINDIPLLGVCLGHQSLGQSFGGVVKRAQQLWHGKTDVIHHRNTGLMQGLPQGFIAARYHSLIVDTATLPSCFEVDATTCEGVIMAMHHVSKPMFGLQFHPESIKTEYGDRMIQNFLKISLLT